MSTAPLHLPESPEEQGPQSPVDDRQDRTSNVHHQPFHRHHSSDKDVSDTLAGLAMHSPQPIPMSIASSFHNESPPSDQMEMQQINSTGGALLLNEESHESELATNDETDDIDNSVVDQEDGTLRVRVIEGALNDCV